MKVQVCDLNSKGFSSDLLGSLTQTGFAVLVNHGIPIPLIRSVQIKWRSFFQEDADYKSAFINTRNPNLGYKGLKQETAVGAKLPDLKEFFHWRRGQDCPFGLMNYTRQVYEALQTLGVDILKVIDGAEGTRYANDCLASDKTLFRALYYPALDFSLEPGAVRAAAHEDINHITLLLAATSPGLQVRDLEGNWHDVPHEENSITVNIGDMLQLASGGKYKSTTHRVVNAGDAKTDRISMPLFIHPHSTTLLAPGITAESFLNERLATIYGVQK